MKKRIEKTGVVAEFEGEYWGIQYADGQCTVEDFGPIEKADVSNPEFCTKPTDKTWTPRPDSPYNPDYEKLQKATLKKIIIETIYKVEE